MKLLLQKLLLLTIFIGFLNPQESKACHAVALVNFTQQIVGTTGIQVTAASDSPTCGCDEYWLDLEVRCMNEAFDAAPFNPGFWGPLMTYPYFQSAQMLKPTCTILDYPWINIPFGGLCPGMTYQYRMRENHNGQVGPWAPTQTFTVPGTSVALDVNINASNTVICVGDCVTLDAAVIQGCGLAAINSWSTGATTNSITVCPTATTTYTLDVTEQCSGDTDQASITITVTPPPVAGTASISTTTICAGDPVTVSVAGSSGVIQWQSSTTGGAPWTNIAGATGASYTDPGPVNSICYQAVITGCGTPANVTTNSVCVTVDPAPIANFTFNAGCLGSAVAFTNTSNVNGGSAIATYAWDFGDGTTSTVQNPSHTYPGVGPYNVTLTVTNGSGCDDNVIIPVTMAPNPTANFTSIAGCVGAISSFADQSVVGGGAVINGWNWNFGNGNTSTAQNPTNIYTAAGTYNVTLTVTTADGCTSTIILTIVVPTNPVANFTPINACDGFAASFTNSSTGATAWLWDFGNGNTSTAQNPTHTYGAAGTYNVTLTGSAGTCTDNITFPVTIYPSPVANFTFVAGCEGSASTFTNTTTGAISWSWDFGDGNTSTAQNPTNVYATAGTYNVQLTATSANGCVNVVTIPVVVPSIPVANFTSNIGCPATLSTFTDVSTVLGASNINAWSWDFGDGNTSIAQNPSNTYTNAGNYNVTLTVTTDDGCSHQVVIGVTVPPTTIADFTTTNVCDGFAASFADNSVGASGWSWDFGDGNTSTVQNPIHTYGAPGTYNVTLISSAGVCTDNVTLPITVYPSPVAGFTFVVDCEGSATSFTNSSTGSTSWSWDFGDGNTSTAQNPTNVFVAGGTYNVELTATSVNGCVNVITIPVVVPEIPVADFTYNIGCPGTASSFSDVSAVGGASNINSWSWNFGDGNTSTLQNPTNIYALSGTYNVTLSVTTDDGCAHQVVIPVVVFSSATADFNALDVCDGNAAQFNDASTGVTAWSWNFGDGNTSILQNPTHTYGAPGTYNVTLVASAGMCTDNITYPITINPSPVSGFNFVVDCEGSVTNFTDLSAGVTGWSWDFGDGNTSIAQNPANNFANAGTFNVQLAVINGFGCVDTLVLPVIVPEIPVVGFTSNMGCINTPSMFTDTSSVGGGENIVSWLWDFGDGNTSTAQNPSNTYTASGSFNVVLTVTSSAGCSNTITIPSIVPPTTIADFTAPDVCDGYSAVFTDNSIGANGWMWDFGDGNTSTLQNPMHTYAMPGTYNVTLTSFAGPCSDQSTNAIIVNPTPTPDFTFVVECPGIPTAFTDVSTVAMPNTITGWLWDFGDGNTSATQNPSNTYAAAGVYTVQLIVTSSTGCVDSIQYTVDIPYIPTAAFLMSNVCDGVAGGFNGASTVTGALIDTWAWDMGDGSVFATQNVTHTYPTSNTYNVTLTVTSNLGCSDDTVMAVTIYPNPIADFLAPNVCDAFDMNFIDNSNGNGGTINQWNWDMDNNGVVDSTIQNPSHQFPNDGTYNVGLTVTTTNGCSGSTIIPVTVDPSPTADFTVVNICEGQAANFMDMSAVLPGNITGWDWNFGNGNTSILQNPSETFGAQNLYIVELIATTAQGCKDTVSHTLDVYPNPVADFTPLSVCLNAPVNFLDASTVATNFTPNIINQWDWDLGDGTLSSLQNPATHVYAVPGVYNVSLTVTSDNGCTDVMTVPLSIYEKPVADFTFNDDCFYNNASFTDASTVVGSTITSWAWSFDDGNSSVLQNPINMYANAGSYNVQLIVQSAFGCEDTITQQIVRYPRPFANFTVPAECVYDSLCMTNLSSVVAPSTLISNVWSFGDGSQLSGANEPCHLYATEGNYCITLIASSDHGCIDDTLICVDVHPEPIVNFTAVDVCINQPPTLFSNTSSVVTGSMAQWFWNFGDGSAPGSQQDPSHTYGLPGTYNVQLLGVSDMGCVDSVAYPVTVFDKPTAVINADTTEGCAPLTVNFVDASVSNATSITSWEWDFGNGDVSALEDPSGIVFDGSGTTLDIMYDVSLIVTNNDGCYDTITIADFITVHPDPVADFYVTPAETDEHNPVVQFTNASILSDSYYWDFMDGSSSIDVDPDHFYADTGVFEVMLVAYTQYGCADTTYDLVTISPVPLIHVPNAFSPDGDGTNDIFMPVLYAHDSYDYEFYVYDRWGQIVFESFSPSVGWDGNIKGQVNNSKTDVFVWKVILKATNSGERKEFLGHVTLLK